GNGGGVRTTVDLCPNPRVSKLVEPSSGHVGPNKYFNRNNGGSDTNSRGLAHSQKTTSFKDILENRGGRTPSKNSPNNQTYLVDLAEDIPSLIIENPEVEEYYKNLSRDVVIERFNDFDLHTYTVTKMLVWAMLPNPPLHLWYALEDIGKTLGKFLKEDLDKMQS
ncbi:hypothetical protein KI387_021843, partial [Taxus chinensis]